MFINSRKYFLFLFYLCIVSISLIVARSVKADSACGAAAYCTGSNTYLKVDDCTLNSFGNGCSNVGTHNVNMTCPTGGGSGSCVGSAPGRLGCQNTSPVSTTTTTCLCTAGGQSCSGDGSPCSNPNSPYNSGSCSCNTTTSGLHCNPPDQNTTLGCCLAGTYCGDGTCNGAETCGSCPADCSAFCGSTPVPLCGNGIVNSGENCVNCPDDVGTCDFCGNGTVDSGETCSNCPQDAGQCPPVCGNHIIESGETCSSCPADVGACSTSTPTCGNGVVNSGETCSNCPADVGACQVPPAPTCTCSAPYCGQYDSCGTSLCSDRDDRAAPAPIQASPADAALVTTVDSTSGGVPTKAVTLTITTQSDPNFNSYYTYVDVYPVGTSCANALAKCNQLVASGSAKGATVTYTYHIPTSAYGAYSNFQWRVWHKNNTCTTRTGTSSAWSEFTVGDTISGTVLRDDGVAGLSGGVCISPFSPVPYQPADGLITVNYNGTDYTTSVNSDGTWQVIAPVSSTGQNTVSLSSSNATDACGCPSGCQYTGVDSPSSNLSIYYQPQDIRDSWWQTIGGSVFTGDTTGTALQSLIPVDTCLGVDCSPYLNLKNDADEADSSGGTFTGGGSIDTSNDVGYQTGNIDAEGRNLNATDASTDTLVENYSYFYRLYSMGINPANDLTANPNKPTTAPANTRAYYYNGDMTINNAWSLTSTESIVVFVNGNLTINNSITVPEGGFLAFIVSGDTTIGSTVCQNDPTSTVANIQGVFVSDGAFNVASTGSGDCKFVGEGIFTAWNGFSLHRDYRDGGSGDFLNAKNPAEVFRYRPDFVVNTPARMTRPIYQWQEIAP